MKLQLPKTIEGTLKEISNLLKNNQLIKSIIITDLIRLKETITKNDVIKLFSELQTLPLLESISIRDYDAGKLILKHWNNNEKIILKSLTNLSIGSIPGTNKKVNLTFVGKEGVQERVFWGCIGKEPNKNSNLLYFQDPIPLKYTYKSKQHDLALNLGEADDYDEKKTLNQQLAQTDVMIICVNNPLLLEEKYLNEYLNDFYQAKKKTSSSKNILSKLNAKRISIAPTNLNELLPVLIVFDNSNNLTKESSGDFIPSHSKIPIYSFNGVTGQSIADIISASLEIHYKKIFYGKYQRISKMLLDNERVAYELFNAVKKNEIEKVKSLIKHVNIISKTGLAENTPLHWAALYNHTELFELLVQAMRERGISLAIPNKNNQIPLELAKNQDIVKLLSDENKTDENETVQRTVSRDNLAVEVNRKRLHAEDKIKAKLAPSLPDDLELGAAISEGDCFFDAMAQGINQLTGKPECTTKSLRLLCDAYAKDLTNSWVKAAILKDKDDYEQYLTRIQFTAAEMEANEHKGLNLGPAVWGRPAIEGRMICEKFNIKLHIIEVPEESKNAMEPPPLMEQLVDAVSSRSIEPMQKTAYADPRMLHLVISHLHFVPLIKKIPKNSTALTMTQLSERSHENLDNSISSQHISELEQIKEGKKELILAEYQENKQYKSDPLEDWSWLDLYNEEIGIISKRIIQITGEIRLLQSLSMKFPESSSFFQILYIKLNEQKIKLATQIEEINKKLVSKGKLTAISDINHDLSSSIPGEVIQEKEIMVKFDKAVQTESVTIKIDKSLQIEPMSIKIERTLYDQYDHQSLQDTIEKNEKLSLELQKIKVVSQQNSSENDLQNYMDLQSVETTLLKLEADSLSKRETKLIQDKNHFLTSDSQLKQEFNLLDASQRELEDRLKDLEFSKKSPTHKTDESLEESLNNKRKMIEIEKQHLSEKAIELNQKQEKLDQLQEKLNSEQAALVRDKENFDDNYKQKELEFQQKLNEHTKKQETLLQQERFNLDQLEKEKINEINSQKIEIDSLKLQTEKSQKELQLEKKQLIQERQQLIEEAKQLKSNIETTEQELLLLKQKEEAMNDREAALKKRENEIKELDVKLTAALAKLNHELEEIKSKQAALATLSQERGDLEKRRLKIKKDQEEANRLKELAEKAQKKVREAEELLYSQLHINPTNYFLKAIQKNDSNALEAYLKVGLDPNLVDEKTGNTPLHNIVKEKVNDSSLNLVKLLLSAGANPTVLNKENKTPLQILYENKKYAKEKCYKLLASNLQQAENNSKVGRSIDLFTLLDKPISSEQEASINNLLNELLALRQRTDVFYKRAIETNIIQREQIKHFYNIHGENCFSLIFEDSVVRLPALNILRSSLYQLAQYVKEAENQNNQLHKDLNLCQGRIGIMLRGLQLFNTEFDVKTYYANYHCELLIGLSELSKDRLLQQTTPLADQDYNNWQKNCSFLSFDETALKKLDYTQKVAKKIANYTEKELKDEIKTCLEPQRNVLEQLIQSMVDLIEFCRCLYKIIDYEMQLSKLRNEQLKEVRAYYTKFQKTQLIVNGHKPRRTITLQGHTFELWEEAITPEEEKCILQETGYKISRVFGTNKIQVGFGKTGTLYIGQNLQSKIIVALKEVKGWDNLKEVSSERLIHEKLSGLPNILSLIASGVDEDKERNPAFYQVTPLADFGNGERLLEKLGLITDLLQRLKIVKYVAQNLLRGIVAMHEQKQICHLDIKLENFIICKGQICLIDFGFSREFSHNDYYIKKEGIPGDTRYSAPERLAHERYIWNSYGNRSFTEYVEQYDARLSDAWSIGIVLLELLLQEHPLPVKTTSANTRQAEWDFKFFETVIASQFQKPNFRTYEQTDQPFCAIIKGLLVIDPNSRMIVKEAFEKCQAPVFKESESKQIFSELNKFSLEPTRNEKIMINNRASFFKQETLDHQTQNSSAEYTHVVSDSTFFNPS